MKILRLRNSQCHCRACGQSFRSVSGFDRHRTGPADVRRCLSATELNAAGWRINPAGFWLMPANRDYTIAQRQMSALQAEPVSPAGCAA
jgi:hypothetical protein